MAKRKSQGFLDVLYEIAAMLPWWVGVVLAAGAYLILHRIAIREVAVVAAPGEMGDIMSAQFLRAFAIAGQYILPIALGAGAVASAIGRWKRGRLLSNIADYPMIDAMSGLTWREFEMLVGEYYRTQGYRVEECGGGGADGGVDLVLRSNSEKVLVQCKHWKARMVRVSVVRELYGVLISDGANRAILLTSGEVTSEARSFAEGKPLEIVTGSNFDRLIKSARKAVAQGDAQPNPGVSHQQSTGCPLCGSPMVRRRAAKGRHAGIYFYGCSRYPSCRGIRSS